MANNGTQSSTSGFDVNAARQAGYSDDEILQHLQQSRKFDVAGALQSGYSKGDVINYLASTPAPAAASAAPQGTPGVLGTALGFGKGLLSTAADTINLGGGLTPVVWATQLGEKASGVAPTMRGTPSYGIQTPQPKGTAENIGYWGEKAAETAAPVAASIRVAKSLPTAAKAGAVFNAVSDAVGDDAVDVSKVGDVALEAQDWASRGGTRIKQISDFLRRATAPNAQPISFDEARDFFTNSARRLTPEESKSLAPQAKRYLAQFASAMNDALEATANAGGVGDQYAKAREMYRSAMGLNEAWETTKDIGKDVLGGMVTQTLKNAPSLGLVYSIAKKYVP